MSGRLMDCSTLKTHVDSLCLAQSSDNEPQQPRDPMKMQMPKGLARAVLAAVPLPYGVPGDMVRRDTTYRFGLVGIGMCAAMFMVCGLGQVHGLFAALLGK